jgi:HSP20 family protein
MRYKELAPVTPFALMRRLTDEMDRLFEEVNIRRPFGFFAPEKPIVEWVPPLEVFEKDKKLFVRAELPGLRKEEVKIEITDELLTIEGERKEDKEIKEKDYVRTERVYGRFFRQIVLPEGVKADLAKAVFTDGVLEIELPVEVKKPVVGRKLPIEEPKKELVGV